MLNNLEFGSVKLLRKSLHIVSAVAIIVSQLVKYSTGDIVFFGFTIPSNNTPLLNKFMFCIVSYFLVALIIRYSDEEFMEFYKRKIDKFEKIEEGIMYRIEEIEDGMLSKIQKEVEDSINSDPDMANYFISSKYLSFMKKSGWVKKTLTALVMFIDIIFPFVLGIIALIFSWAF